MSALALMLKKRGVKVSGSDIRKSEITENLVKNGIVVRLSHTKEAVMSFNPDIVVFSLSVDSNNCEYKAALNMDIPIVLRSELLGAIMEDYSMKIGISGSHGKSTVTAMLGAVLNEDKKAPTVLCGAEICNASGLIDGDEKYLVYEACEYGDSFLNFNPDVQLLLNLDLDHTDYFKSESMIVESFLKSANNAKNSCVLNLDSKNLALVSERSATKMHTYSRGTRSEYRYETLKRLSGTYSFNLYRKENLIGEYITSLKGEFNAVNAVAAAVCADVIGVPYESSRKAIEEFRGLKRRLEGLGKIESFELFYDYAHHPCEISATKSALSDMGYRRTAVIFAPHTYSRTAYFLNEFAKELSKFDEVYITDIYGARENAVVGINASALANKIRDMGGISHAIGVYDAKTVVQSISGRDFDCVVLMGAGEIEEYKQEFLKYRRR